MVRPRLRRGRLLFGVLSLLTATVHAALPAQPCPGSGLAVTAAVAADAEMACEGGRRAVSFLDGLGLQVPEGILLEVVDGLPQLYGSQQLGSFDAKAGRIRVLSYARCEQIGHDVLLFGQPLSPDLYRSLVAHEVAHAVFDANLDAPGPHLGAQEYIAYTAQFVAMSPALRDRILDISGVRAFENEIEISPTRYFLSPQAFGIAAYRHFAGDRGGHDFVRRLLHGEFRTSLPEGY